MPDEYPTIRKQLDAELEQLAQGVALDRRQEFLARVRPALYAIQEQLAVEESAAGMVKISGTASRVNSLIQTQEAFADDLLAVEQTAEKTLAEKDRVKQERDSLEQSIYNVGRETTSRIQQISKRIASMAEGNNFTAEWDTLNYKVQAEINNSLIRISLMQPEQTPREINGEYKKEMEVDIEPESGKMQIRYEQALYKWKRTRDKRSYYSTGKDRRKVLKRLSWLTKSPEDAFRIVAGAYIANPQDRYLQTFLDMYAILPKALSEASRKFLERETAKREELEKTRQRLEEGTR